MGSKRDVGGRVHGGGALLSPTCTDGQNAYGRRWDAAPYRGGNDFRSLQGQLGSVVL